MKKLISFACICAVGAAWADANPMEIKCGNDIGMLTINSTNADTIVAVPFGELATDGSVCASNIVKTANLTKGDDLYVYNPSTKKWLAWDLDEAGDPAYLYWKSIGEVSIDAKGKISQGQTADPAETYLVPGSAIWLKRQNPKDEKKGEANPFYVYGSYKPALSTAVTAGAYNLIANPLDDETVIPGVEEGDKVKLVNSATSTTIYTYKPALGGWGYMNSTGGVDVVSTLMLPAGQGAWYRPKSTRDIVWRSAE